MQSRATVTQPFATWAAANEARDRLAADDGFSRYGIDSLKAAGITAELSTFLQQPLPRTLLWDHPSIAAVARTTQKVAIAARKVFAADGVSLQQASERAGGQVVFHLHMHVMPRHDGVALLPAASRKEDLKVLEDHATRMIAALRA